MHLNALRVSVVARTVLHAVQDIFYILSTLPVSLYAQLLLTSQDQCVLLASILVRLVLPRLSALLVLPEYLWALVATLHAFLATLPI